MLGARWIHWSLSLFCFLDHFIFASFLHNITCKSYFLLVPLTPIAIGSYGIFMSYIHIHVCMMLSLHDRREFIVYLVNFFVVQFVVKSLLR